MVKEIENDNPHIMRTWDFNSGKNIWVIFDKKNVMYGKPTDSRVQLQARWALMYGKPKGWVRYEGIAKPSELAVTVADHQQPTTGE